MDVDHDVAADGVEETRAGDLARLKDNVAVGGNVMVYIHKEHELDDVERRCPADHYVLVDDKVWILAAIKAAWGARRDDGVPRQGHYASTRPRSRATPCRTSPSSVSTSSSPTIVRR